MSRLNLKQLEAYQFAMREAQKLADEQNKTLKLPPVPMFMNEETAIVVKVFRNMSKIWHNAGESIPNLFEHRALLLKMGQSEIAFERRKTK